ncbi:MAG TPA: hypothetical protein VFN97_04860 [Actinospica sp.]|nr:hypothetical protein [Actinospica sp.]
MTVIGLTGHQEMPLIAFEYAERELRRLLADDPDPRGMCSLAAGADQLFARLVLEAGGSLHAVIPSRDYDRTFGPADLATYRELLAAAAETTVLDYDEPGEPAYYAAGLYVVEHCDLLAAVWNGEPARGLGGTGDIVRYAGTVGRPVTILWPRGVRRS